MKLSNQFPYSLYQLGDHAVTIELGFTMDDPTHVKVMQVFQYLQQQKTPEIRDIIPAYASVSIVFDLYKLMQDYPELIENPMMERVNDLLAGFIPIGLTPGTLKRIPVCYDLSLALDMEAMASQKKMFISDLVELHLSVIYKVYMIGFIPGFAYMGKVPDLLVTPRKAEPRRRVEAGSIGIAGAQTGIYPLACPGGWNIIGRTPLQMFEANRQKPVLLEPGDRVQFEPISLKDFNLLNHRI